MKINTFILFHFCYQLVTDYKASDAQVVKILNSWDFFIVPSLNVDGYAYTWSTVSLANNVIVINSLTP